MLLSGRRSRGGRADARPSISRVCVFSLARGAALMLCIEAIFLSSPLLTCFGFHWVRDTYKQLGRFVSWEGAWCIFRVYLGGFYSRVSIYFWWVM